VTATGPQIVYSAQARIDLLAIETYIAINDGETRAELIIGRLEEALLNLAYMPGMGRSRPYLESGARAFAVAPWLIVYELLPSLDSIAVLRVIDGRRDLDAVFAKLRKRPRRRT
jgi:plasmid stabilization system protein ParE